VERFAPRSAEVEKAAFPEKYDTYIKYVQLFIFLNLITRLQVLHGCRQSVF